MTIAKTLVAVVAVAGLLSGCTLTGSYSDWADEAHSTSDVDLTGAVLTVGGKAFTEQLILCEATAQLLVAAGAQVQRSCGMSGSSTVRTALLSGDVDLYWEYTGTGWLTHLQRSGGTGDPARLFAALRDADAAHGVTWEPPAPANSTYGVAVSAAKARELGVRSISDYADLARRAPAVASFCGAAEFFGRDDGWPGLRDAYGFDLPATYRSELAMGAVYHSVGRHDPCIFGEVLTTDGRIPALDLTVLTDDRGYFPVYNPSVSVRTDSLARYPGLARLLEPMSAALTDRALRELNARVDVEGQAPEQVALDWLHVQGWVAG